MKTSTWCRSYLRIEVCEKLLFPVAIDRVDELADRLGGSVAGCDLDGRRVTQDRAGQPSDVVRERRREHQVLTALRKQLDDPLDVGHETHVEHPVGFVENEHLHLPEVRDALADEVEEAAGRRGQDLDPGSERLDLGLHRDAAVDDGRAQRHGAAIGAHGFIDLDGELARRHEDQDADRVACRGERGVGVAA